MDSGTGQPLQVVGVTDTYSKPIVAGTPEWVVFKPIYEKKLDVHGFCQCLVPSSLSKFPSMRSPNSWVNMVKPGFQITSRSDSFKASNLAHHNAGGWQSGRQISAVSATTTFFSGKRFRVACSTVGISLSKKYSAR